MVKLVTKRVAAVRINLVVLSPLTAILIGVVLRLLLLGAQDLWYDEAFTAMMSSLPIHRLLEATAGDVHPPLWYLIERGFILLFGNSELVLRLPAALCSIAALALLPALARSFGLGRRAVLVSTWIFALAPFQIAYAQEARMYALLLLAVMLAVWGIQRRRYWLYALASLAMLYTHNLGALYWGVLLVGVLVEALIRDELKLGQWVDWRFVYWSFVVGVLYAPWGVVTLGQVADVAGSFWVQRPTWGAPVLVLHRLWWGNAPLPSLGVPTALLSGLGIHAVIYALVYKRAWSLSWLSFAPLAVTYLASLLSPVLVARTMIGCTPFLAIGLGLALAEHRRARWLALAAAPLLLIVLVSYYVLPAAQKGDMTPIVQPVETAYRPNANDVVFHTSVASYILLSYYLPDCEHVLWRQANDLSQSLTDQTKQAMGMTQVDGIDALLEKYDRVWGYWSDSPVTSQAESQYVAQIRAGYALDLDHFFPVDDWGLIESGVYLVTNSSTWSNEIVTKE